MAMTGGGGHDGPNSSINITPLIDVMLVLLIIFMVITPLTPKGLEALVPQPPKDNAPPPPDTQQRTIVVQLISAGGGAQPGLKINQEDVTWDTLEGRLRDIYKTRAEKVMFVKGDSDVMFENVAQVIDMAKAADPDMKVGLITAKVEAGQ